MFIGLQLCTAAPWNSCGSWQCACRACAIPVEKFAWLASQRLASLPEREKCDVHSAPFHGSDVGAINAHSRTKRFLAQAGGKTQAPQVQTKEFPNIHPEDGQQSGIILLGII